MKKRSFQVSEHGNLLMYDREYSAADVKNIIETNRLNGLRIFDFWDPLPSLDFLRDFVFLKSLSVTCRDDQNYSFLRDMPQLEDLSIGPSFPMENSIDLSHQVNLMYLALQWRKDQIHGLDFCRNLGDLCLIEFKDVDFKLITNLTKITRLRIKTGSMKTLEGIENLNKLDQLELGNCRNLRSVSNLSGLPEIKTIRIESCRNIKDYQDLNELPKLATLQLVNCGPISAVDFKKSFPNLEHLQFLGNTKIIE